MRALCSECGEAFEAKHRNAIFCGAACRQRSSRANRTGARPAEVVNLTPVAPPATEEAPLIIATRRELEDAGKLDTVVGQLALELAEKVCSERDTGSAKAAASKEFRAVMAEALADVAKQADGLDELMARRMQKASGA